VTASVEKSIVSAAAASRTTLQRHVQSHDVEINTSTVSHIVQTAHPWPVTALGLRLALDHNFPSFMKITT